ncbi:MAG: ABC transporter permease subunit [Armatimonadetes bacterium]|nr:ABC transporter permease subunit [Armatimonadota bacterium]
MGHVQREFTKILFQKRSLIGWAGLLVLPFIIAAAVSLSSGNGLGPGGPETGTLDVMMNSVKTNGMLLPVVVMGMLATFLIPLLASMMGAQTIAGEAEKGTLRTSLMQPVRRTGILVSKWIVANLYVVIGLLILALAGLIAGAAFFGLHPITLNSGQAIGTGDTLLRMFAAFGYVFLGMVAIVSIAVLLSTVTDSSLTAVAVALVLVIVMLVLGNLSVFSFLKPYLITGHLDAWGSFFSSPVDWGPIWKGILNFAVWSAGAVGLALWRFRMKDISS